MSQFIDVSNATAPVKSVARRWKFSKRFLIGVVTAICAVIAMIAFPPLALVALLVSVIAMAIVFLIASIFGRGWIRPFSICGGVALAIGFLFWIDGPGRPEEFLVLMLVQAVGAIVFGFCGAAAHGFLKRWSGVVPVPNIPILKNFLHNPDIEFKD